MRKNYSHYLLAVLLAFGIASSNAVLAEDVTSKANLAAANVIFDHDAHEFSSYSVNDVGFLDITFASNTPDALYSEILNNLQKHPDIKGVLSGKNGPVCSTF